MVDIFPTDAFCQLVMFVDDFKKIISHYTPDTYNSGSAPLLRNQRPGCSPLWDASDFKFTGVTARCARLHKSAPQWCRVRPPRLELMCPAAGTVTRTVTQASSVVVEIWVNSAVPRLKLSGNSACQNKRRRRPGQRRIGLRIDAFHG